MTLTSGSGVGGNNPNGGALHVAFNATLTLTDSAVTNSDSQNGNGGGIYTDGNLTLNRVTVSGNEATGAAAPTNGGGIYHNSNNNPPRLLTITNSTISGNTTNGNGGGIYSAAGSLDLQSTTIAGNTAGERLRAVQARIRDRDRRHDHRRDRRYRRVRRRGRRRVQRQQQPRDRRDVLGRRGGRPAPRDARRQRRSDEHARPRVRRARRSGRPARLRTAAREPISAGSHVRRAAPATSGRTSSARRAGGGEELPPPVAGKNVNLLPKSGTVRVKLPGRRRFRELAEGEQLPVGTTVDTLKGRVTLEAAGDQTADFYAGIFKIRQGKAAKPMTTLTLTEKLSCPKAGNAIAAAKKKKRRLWGDGSGKFRTKGKHSAATVVGTKWLVEDRCKSTLTRVVRGRVSVRDFAKKKTVIVRAGKRYIARAG